MTRKEVTFTRIIRSRGMAIIIALAAIFMTVQAYAFGKIPHIPDFRTIAFPTPSEWVSSSLISMWVNMALVGATAEVMILINRHFNLLRTTSVFFVAYFAFTMAATLAVLGQLSASSILALFVMGGIWILFSIYDIRPSSRRVFLAFFLLGLGLMVEYTFALYIPLFIAGLGLMKILRVKKIIAASLGIITPAWIAWGLDIVPVPEAPHFEFTPPALVLSTPTLWPLLASAALTLLTGFFFGCFNLLKIMGFNAQARAYNGLLALISISTGIFAIVNFTNIAFYTTVLNACVAFQVGHFFRLTVMRRGYIAVMTVMIAYLGIYIWAMTI